MKQLPEIILTRGLPGSGKSTWAREMCKEHPEFNVISKDVIRKEIRERRGLDYWVRVDEGEVLKIRDALIKSYIQDGKSVIVDDTNLNPIHEKTIRQKFGEEAYVRVKSFAISLEECIRRDDQRPPEKRVGEKVIKKMYNQYLNPIKVESIPWVKGRQFIYMCDIDGTLADNNGRNPYDMSKVAEDLPIDPVVNTIKQLMKQYKIVFLSGRNEIAKKDTLTWLSNIFEYADSDIELYMRADEDTRKDSIIKHELFEKYIRDKYNVIAVFDDRNQVVDMWRRIGLTCFQVAEGDF